MINLGKSITNFRLGHRQNKDKKQGSHMGSLHDLI